MSVTRKEIEDGIRLLKAGKKAPKTLEIWELALSALEPKPNRCTVCNSENDSCCVAIDGNCQLKALAALNGPLAVDLEAQREAWEQTANQAERNKEYYRGLVVEIGKTLGKDACTCDDGSMSPDVLCAKVPELVKALLERCERMEKALHVVDIVRISVEALAAKEEG